ncbi:hypothetical protein TNCV_1670181 [Trichonephila clavipes]|nr:hypothetical protein TNCV_1670181 [Trichonephila clavipes]
MPLIKNLFSEVHQAAGPMILEAWQILALELLKNLVLTFNRRCQATIAIMNDISLTAGSCFVVLPRGQTMILQTPFCQ